METRSIGSPLMMLAPLALTIFIAFSASLVQSESTTQKSPSEFHHSPPPPSTSHNNRPPPPPPSTSHQNRPPPPPPPSKSHHNQAPHQPPPPHHQPPPPDEKAAISTTARHKGLNTGEIVGLVFSVIAMILQIGVVGYLTYKRNQLYHSPD